MTTKRTRRGTPKKRAKARRAPTKRRRVDPATPRAADTWPAEPEWRQSGLCAEAQADGVPCTVVGRRCELCERAQSEPDLSR
jgi:hypothetical protein